MTYMQAALAILTHTERPLSVGELTAVAVAQGLVRPRGYTPDRTMSSILYRRMASDPDAPLICANGRFWLRGRPLPTDQAGVHAVVRHTRRIGVERRRAASEQGQRARRVSVLPAPPLIPLLSLAGAGSLLAGAPAEASSGAGKRERAVARLEARLRSLSPRLDAAMDGADDWDAGRTHSRLTAPLLTLLGYRKADQQALGSARGRVASLLRAGAGQSIVLEVCRAGQALSDEAARPTLARAAAAGAPWALLTNGQELRLYASVLAEGGSPAGALVLRLELYRWPDGATVADAARALWLLSRQALAAGALDAYRDSLAVGAALLDTLEDPASPLVEALAEAVTRITGLRLPAPLLARHARLAIRGSRGRDGEPALADVTTVAAIGSGGEASQARTAERAAS